MGLPLIRRHVRRSPMSLGVRRVPAHRCEFRKTPGGTGQISGYGRCVVRRVRRCHSEPVICNRMINSRASLWRRRPRRFSGVHPKVALVEKWGIFLVTTVEVLAARRKRCTWLGVSWAWRAPLSRPLVAPLQYFHSSEAEVGPRTASVWCAAGEKTGSATAHVQFRDSAAAHFHSPLSQSAPAASLGVRHSNNFSTQNLRSVAQHCLFRRQAPELKHKSSDARVASPFSQSPRTFRTFAVFPIPSAEAESESAWKAQQSNNERANERRKSKIRK